MYDVVLMMLTKGPCAVYPAGFGGLKSLVKLQASYNPFESLPNDMCQLPALELFRLAVGHLPQWPAQLGEIRLRACLLVALLDTGHYSSRS